MRAIEGKRMYEEVGKVRGNERRESRKREAK